MGQSGKNNSVPTFRMYQKHPFPENMVVDIIKLEMHDKSVVLLSKILKLYGKYVDIEINQER